MAFYGIPIICKLIYLYIYIYELADLVFKGTLVEGVYSGLEYWLEVLAVPRGPKTESAERPLL